VTGPVGGVVSFLVTHPDDCAPKATLEHPNALGSTCRNVFGFEPLVLSDGASILVSLAIVALFVLIYFSGKREQRAADG